MTRFLITGGSGFIGSSLAVSLAIAGSQVVCLDNLSRRGSELLLGRLLRHGCRFIHGDIRNPDDLARLEGRFDALIECSAEPSVLAGARGEDARRVVDINLAGALNCFEFARARDVPVLFFSTSRVYPYERINALRFAEGETRFELREEGDGAGPHGIATGFPLAGRRSLYGATKLAAELILQEYSANYDLPAVIDRFGVVAGPWQLGRVDQGVFTHWLASHYFGRPLDYIGFGGAGKQVRDLLHVDDLAGLVKKQLARIATLRGEVFNAGGSTFSSLSLLEATDLCRRITGKAIPIGGVAETRPADVKWYVTDNRQVEAAFDWRPLKPPAVILADIHAWLAEHAGEFASILGGPP